MIKAKPEFYLGRLAYNSLRLLTDNWQRVLWIYVSIALVPSVLFGEIMDEPTDWLFPILGPILNELPEKIVRLFFDLPQWIFFGVLTAVLLARHQKQKNAMVRSLSACLVIIILLHVYQFTLVVMTGKTQGFEIWSAVLFILIIFLSISIVFIFPAVAAATPSVTRWPYELWRLSSGVRWKLLMMPLIFMLLGSLSQEAEKWFLKLLAIPDGTLLDWVTTFMQEIISSAYLIITVVVGVTAYEMLKRRQDGAPLAETAAVFD
jgi:hypothetical protein